MGLIFGFTVFYVIIAILIMVAIIVIKLKFTVTDVPPDLPNIPQLSEEEKARTLYLVQNDNTIMGRKQKWMTVQ